MNSVNFRDVLSKRDEWLEEQIRQMSVDVLRLGTYTCTTCGEVEGDYIIDYMGKKYRLSAVETYAFLKFILESALRA